MSKHKFYTSDGLGFDIELDEQGAADILIFRVGGRDVALPVKALQEMAKALSHYEKTAKDRE